MPGHLNHSDPSLDLVDPPVIRRGSDTVASDPRLVRVYAGGPGLIRPGAHVLAADGTVSDLVRAAGGLHPEARRSVVPREHPLVEGLRLYVPRGPGPKSDRWSKESSMWYDTAPVNVNRASTDALQALPGIGPVLAGRIVEQRRREGPFGSLKALGRVRGIGERTVRRLRRRASVFPTARSDTPVEDPRAGRKARSVTGP